MNILKWLLGILVCAWLGQYVLALLMPNVIMEMLYLQGDNRGGYNRLVVSPIADDTARSVVRPSPDLLYASCIYNLDDGPIEIDAQVPQRYWSMQFYQMNTDNFAGITNQRDERHRAGTRVKVTLVGVDENVADYQGMVIQSPTNRGIILLRVSTIGDRTQQTAAIDSSRCGPIGS